MVKLKTFIGLTNPKVTFSFKSLLFLYSHVSHDIVMIHDDVTVTDDQIYDRNPIRL